MADDYGATIVFDMGSDMMRCGYGDHYNPHAIFPQVVGSPKGQTDEQTKCYVGDEAVAKRDSLDLRYPIKNGKITNWDDMERIWKHCYESEIHAFPDRHPVLIAEALGFHRKTEKQHVGEIMFETLDVPSLCFKDAAALVLYQSGRSTGLIVDSGLEETRIVPVYEGYCIPHSARAVALGGKHITNYITSSLEEQGLSGTQYFKNSISRDFKEKLISAHDTKIDLQVERGEEHNSGLYELPDGTTISIPGGRHMAAEILFQPSIIDKPDDFALHRLIHESVGKLDCDIETDMYANIILVGGNMGFAGLGDRLEKELPTITHRFPNTPKKVVQPPGMKYMTWLGGAMFSTLNMFHELCIPKEAYEEDGPNVILRSY